MSVFVCFQFILAALIAVSSAARLEHLERGYLPPDQGNQGQGSFGSRGSNGFGSHGSNGDSSGFGSSPVGARSGPSAFHGGSSFNAATSNQYLPPDHGPSGSSFPRPGGSRSQGKYYSEIYFDDTILFAIFPLKTNTQTQIPTFRQKHLLFNLL